MLLTYPPSDEEITFIHPDDLDTFAAWDGRTFELQVANHELLGHGSGKLFQEAADGSKNFDPAKVINPLTGGPITSWYKPGQTSGSVLGECSSSLEECRAETVALYLCSNPTILKLFNVSLPVACTALTWIDSSPLFTLVRGRGGCQDDPTHVLPSDGTRRPPRARVLRPRRQETWPGAHASSVRRISSHLPNPQLRTDCTSAAISLGIFQFMIKEGLATVEEVRDANGKLENLYVRCDKERVLSHGKAAVGKLLVDLQVRKSTADGPGARKFYTELTTPFDGWDGEYRDLVIAKKQVRMFHCVF